MKKIHLALLMLAGLCSLAFVYADDDDESYGYDFDNDDDDDDDDDDFPRCRMEFESSCNHLIDRFVSSGVYNSPESVREAGLRRVCKDVSDLGQCATKVVHSDACADVPQEYKRIYRKGNEFVDMICNDRIDDIEKHWECLLHTNVGDDVMACQNFDPSELRFCDTRDAFHCIDGVFGGNPICKPEAVDLVKSIVAKGVEIIPGCSDKKRLFRKMRKLIRKK